MNDLQYLCLTYIVLFLGLFILLISSSWIVHSIMSLVFHKSISDIAGADEGSSNNTDSVEQAERKNRITTGRIIGKCENILILLLMFLQAYTSLAIIFTAKTIIRKEDIQKNSMFFLVGTMINVTYSIFISILVYMVHNFLKVYFGK